MNCILYRNRSECQPYFNPIFDHTTTTNRLLTNLINEIKELADVVGDGGDVGVGPLQVLLVYLAHALHALIHLYATILEGQRRELVDDLHFSQRYFFFPNF